MASFTTWNRLEPRPRSNSLVGGLQAGVRDPLWLLFRQWQFGEHRGDDAGSPSFIRVDSTTTLTTASRVRGSVAAALPAGPLEPALLAEPRTPDLALRIEIGQELERRVQGRLDRRASADRVAAVTALRLAYPLPSPDGVPAAKLPLAVSASLTLGLLPPEVIAGLEATGITVSKHAICTPDGVKRFVIADEGYDRSFVLSLVDDGVEVRPAPLGDWHGDPEATRLARVCARRALDGFAVLRGLAMSSPILPASAAAWMRDAAAAAASDLARWASTALGVVGRQDPDAWRPERLCYELDLLAPGSSTEALVLTAEPGEAGALPWYAFDRAASVGMTVGVPGAPKSSSTSALAGRIAFPGMPARRWWAIEPSGTSFPALTADHTDVAKLIVIDFMLVHGDDWFIHSLPVPVGSMTRVDALTVHDVFGVATVVSRADAQPASDPAEQWTLYSTTDRAKGGTSEWLLVPATAEASLEHGPEMEVVQFLRDPIADLVWAVDEVVEDGVGLPRPAADWAAARKPSMPGPRAPSSTALRYVLQSDVPENWTPFQPTLIDPALGLYTLRRLRRTGARTWAGRILEPSSLAGATYDIAEVEVPRMGRRIACRTSRTRWNDGSVSVWTSRWSGVGRGEGSSGLRFDCAEPSGP